MERRWRRRAPRARKKRTPRRNRKYSNLLQFFAIQPPPEEFLRGGLLFRQVGRLSGDLWPQSPGHPRKCERPREKLPYHIQRMVFRQRLGSNAIGIDSQRICDEQCPRQVEGLSYENGLSYPEELLGAVAAVVGGNSSNVTEHGFGFQPLIQCVPPHDPGLGMVALRRVATG